MPFWPLCCESEAILFKKFRPGHRAGVFIWESFHLGRKNRDLGNRASPASHMNTSILLQRKEWPGDISETEPARLTGVIWRGPLWISMHWVWRLNCPLKGNSNANKSLVSHGLPLFQLGNLGKLDAYLRSLGLWELEINIIVFVARTSVRLFLNYGFILQLFLSRYAGEAGLLLIYRVSGKHICYVVWRRFSGLGG